MIKIDNKKLEERLNNILKSVEVMGGYSYIKSENLSKEKLLLEIINSVLYNEEFKIKLNNIEYTLINIEKEKLNYEKYLIKNKNKIIQYIIFSIKRNNNELNSKIKKYNKDGNIELYKEVENKIIKIYHNDINKLILSNCNINFEEQYNDKLYYGEYLNSKREQIVQAIISKI